MLVVCWSAKGGSGTTVVAGALALLLARTGPTHLVDLVGDAPAALGVADPAGPGVTEWAGVPHATADALWRLAVPIADGLHLVPVGHADRLDADHLEPAAWERLVTAADTSGTITVVDAGGPPPPVAHAGADRSLLVVRPCYLALRRAAACAGATDAVVVAEPGRALRSADVGRAVGVPVAAEIGWDPAIARAVDAGLLATRLPGELARGLRRLAASITTGASLHATGPAA